MHYHLCDDSHSMDAIVRNKCEAETLAVFIEVAKSLSIPVKIESTTYTDGGLREIWKFIGNNNNQLTLILSIILLIFSRLPVSDGEMDELNKQVAKLTIEEKRLAIEKLKKELSDGTAHHGSIENGAAAIESNLKVAARRSNFYKHLVAYDKVTGVGFTPISLDTNNVAIERYVDRSNFSKFVLPTNKLPVEVVESTTIEIVAPVLKEGNYQWKGIYQDQPISFAMSDDEFKVSVLRKEVVFKHGTVIECVLNVHRKFDEVGDVAITGYSVPTVVSIADGTSQIQTVQGKRYRAQKRAVENQGNLF